MAHSFCFLLLYCFYFTLDRILVAGYEYQVSVHTSGIGYAGTDANVFIKLFSETTYTAEIHLSSSNNIGTNSDLFEQNSVDRFSITTDAELGDLIMCQIRRDDAGRAQGWHLSTIWITNSSPKLFEFQYKKWIDLAANATAIVHCKIDRIGTSCQTECHCERYDDRGNLVDACHQNGSCLPGASCISGWSGKICQKKSATFLDLRLSYNRNANKISDGDPLTYVDVSGTNPYLGIELQSFYNGVIVQVKVGLAKDNPYTICSGIDRDLFVKGIERGSTCLTQQFKTSRVNWTLILQNKTKYLKIKGHTHTRIYELNFYDCNNGVYGEDCSYLCEHCINLNCSITGRCLNGCVNNATGPGCPTCPEHCICSQNRECLTCLAGWYGKNCEHPCSRSCKNNCAKSTGRCSECKVPFFGVLCDKRCPLNCDSNGCKQNNGDCLNCLPQFSGHNCSACVNGFYGLSCTESCLDNCSLCTNKSVCIQCKTGWFGKNCLCKEECQGHCDEQTKMCIRSSKCSIDKCKVCSENGSTCTLCDKGLFGINCDLPCSDGCRDAGCNITTAECMWGCNEGLQGPNCDKIIHVDANDSKSTIVGVLAGIAGLILVLLCALIIFYLIKKKRKSRKSKPSRQTKMSDLLQREKPQVSEDQSSTVQFQNIDVPANVALLSRQKNRASVDLLEEIGSEPYNDHTEGNDRSVYYNFHKGKAVPVDELWEYVEERKAKGMLEQEFSEIPNGLLEQYDIAVTAENMAKNRYKGIYPYNHSRVILTKDEGVSDSDFINACFVNDFHGEKSYIASMGPFTDETIVDFWRMLWQTNTSKVVMLTNLLEEGKEKCKKYWPEEKEKIVYGNINVSCSSQLKLANYTVRHFDIWKANEKRKPLIHFHFTSWPDRGVPRNVTAIVEFRNKVRNTRTPQEGPLVVHCSAGIGRTGTYMALDYLIDEGETTKCVNVVDCMTAMRHQRAKVVQTSEQYVFLHDALVEALNAGRSTVPTNKFHEYYRDLMTKNRETGKSKLQEQYELLVKLSPAFDGNDFTVAKVNKDKHRYSNISAADRYRVFLSSIPEVTDYINAIFLPAYKEKFAFLLTEMPLPNTIISFWYMVFQQRSSSIIMLNNMRKDQTFGIYWPMQEKGANFGPFHVLLMEKESGNGQFDILKMKVTLKTETESEERIVKQFQCKFWPEDAICPHKPQAILDLMESVMTWQRQTSNQPTVVHCMNGAKQSGLYCALFAIIEHLRTEHEVSIFQTILQLRTRREQIVPNKEQLEFCYEAVLAYLETFNMYSNFG